MKESTYLTVCGLTPARLLSFYRNEHLSITLLENFEFIEPVKGIPDYARLVLVNLTKISAEEVISFEAYLDANEHFRLKNITNTEKRHTFVVCRFVTKQLIAEFSRLDPFTLNFQYTERGKPYLAAPGVEFNISHSGDFALIGVSHHKIGVDIEKMKPNRNFQGLAETVLSKDEKAWVFEQDTERRFYQLWTLKESRLKCDGDGLAGHYPAAMFDPEMGWRYNDYEIYFHAFEQYIYTICINAKD
ncbi:MAG: 4'-phosphopantetheinyl transferase superfamily protein [Alphaproteobacteria bacterium]|nr:4'-phosphopantetheinyl transferase superfamily protein [Alphaproteobacteria bacterium]